MPYRLLVCLYFRVMVTGCDDLTRRFLLEYHGVENVPGMKHMETTKVRPGMIACMN